MRPTILMAAVSILVVTVTFGVHLRRVQAGQEVSGSGYTVLDPIRNGSLTVFPVVAAKSYSTGQFLTLDEGFRTGEVVVTEYGNVRGLVRGQSAPPVQRDGAEVNRLVLINNSKRPLLLLAGEIVAGGKQDRVIGKDRIVPAESDPVDLNVFCVEPGRWVASSTNFGASGTTYGSAGKAAVGKSATAGGTLMAQPSVRSKAMADKDQGQVWAEVRKQQESMAVEVEGESASAGPAAAPPSAPLRSTSS
ncbi:MAG: DUF6569 family protein, partial [Candidatus Acidiferrales bacterium]